MTEKYHHIKDDDPETIWDICLKRKDQSRSIYEKVVNYVQKD